MNEIEKPLKSANMHEVVQEWYAKFVQASGLRPDTPVHHTTHIYRFPFAGPYALYFLGPNTLRNSNDWWAVRFFKLQQTAIGFYLASSHIKRPAKGNLVYFVYAS